MPIPEFEFTHPLGHRDVNHYLQNPPSEEIWRDYLNEMPFEIRTYLKETVKAYLDDYLTHKAENASYATDYLMAFRSSALSVPSGQETILPVETLAGDSKASLLTDNGQSINLATGTWLINAKVTFSSNPTKYKKLRFAKTNDSLAIGWVMSVDSKNAVNSSETTLEINRILVVTTPWKFALYVTQSSGGALNVLQGDNNTALSVRRIL